MTTIRPARSDDYDTFATMFLELAVPEPPPPREEFDTRHVQNTFFVCDDTNRPVGYGLGTRVGDLWHVIHVVADRNARGRGVGRAVMDEHARRAREAGLSRWSLNVKRENATAIRLYERCGMHVAQETWAMIIDWADVARLPDAPPWESIVVGPEQDADIEHRFGLAAGDIAAHRARPGRIIVGARTEARVVGFAAFDPTFPGAFPFRPAEPRWTRALLESMRLHARPQDTHVRMVVASDKDLVRTLCDAGARVLLELYRMEGSLG